MPVLESVVFRAGDQDGVNVFERGVLLRIYHVPAAEDETVRCGEDRIVEGIGTCAQESSENSAVATVFRLGVGEGRVALENGDAKGRVRHVGGRFVRHRKLKLQGRNQMSRSVWTTRKRGTARKERKRAEDFLQTATSHDVMPVGSEGIHKIGITMSQAAYR